MKNIKYSLLGLIALCSFVSCENFFNTTVTLPTPEHTPLLAVHAYINNTQNENVEVRVTKSRNIFESTPEENQLIDAVVELYENGTLISNFAAPINVNAQEGYLNPISGDEFGGIGKSYELKVTHPDFGTFSATQVMPDTVPINSINVTTQVGGGEFNGDMSTLNINFDDPEEEENYYEIALFAEIETDNDVYFEQFYFDTEGATSVGTMGYDYGTLLLDDKTFNGQNFTFNSQFYSFGIGGEQEITYKAIWRSVTKDYYLYSVSLRKNSNAEDNPFAEPVSVYTNFEGAIGVFAMRAEHIYSFRGE